MGQGLQRSIASPGMSGKVPIKVDVGYHPLMKNLTSRANRWPNTWLQTGVVQPSKPLDSAGGELEV